MGNTIILPEDPLLRYNRRNQLMICDIECGIIDFYVLRGHAFLVPHVGDFFGRALFDVDVSAGGGVQIDGGGGGADVEGDAVMTVDAMLSQMRVTSMPAVLSSYAVRRAPCRRGRVSSA